MMVMMIIGGNVGLIVDNMYVKKFGLIVKLWIKCDLMLIVNYVSSDIDNLIVVFLSVIVVIEVVFFDCFMCDVFG